MYIFTKNVEELSDIYTTVYNEETGVEMFGSEVIPVKVLLYIRNEDTETGIASYEKLDSLPFTNLLDENPLQICVIGEILARPLKIPQYMQTDYFIHDDVDETILTVTWYNSMNHADPSGAILDHLYETLPASDKKLWVSSLDYDNDNPRTYYNGTVAALGKLGYSLEFDFARVDLEIRGLFEEDLIEFSDRLVTFFNSTLGNIRRVIADHIQSRKPDVLILHTYHFDHEKRTIKIEYLTTNDSHRRTVEAGEQNITYIDKNDTSFDRSKPLTSRSIPIVSNDPSVARVSIRIWFAALLNTSNKDGLPSSRIIPVTLNDESSLGRQMTDHISAIGKDMGLSKETIDSKIIITDGKAGVFYLAVISEKDDVTSTNRTMKINLITDPDIPSIVYGDKPPRSSLLIKGSIRNYDRLRYSITREEYDGLQHGRIFHGSVLREVNPNTDLPVDRIEVGIRLSTTVLDQTHRMNSWVSPSHFLNDMGMSRDRAFLDRNNVTIKSITNKGDDTTDTERSSTNIYSIRNNGEWVLYFHIKRFSKNLN